MNKQQNLKLGQHTENLFSVSSPVSNSMIQICSMCKHELELVSGAVIYGNQWFHGECWDSKKEELHFE